jgi:putative NADPH-quinone reductase
VAHPDPGSLNHALARAVVETWSGLGIETSLRDLHAEGFNPCLTREEVRGEPSTDPLVQDHILGLTRADYLAVVHPNTWGAPPAMMKGWMDRVFAPGAAYAFEKGCDQGDAPRGLLRAKAALVLNTSNTTADREAACFGDPLQRIWRDCLLGYCGVQHVVRLVLRVVATSTPAERAAWLDEVRHQARQVV